MWLEREAGAWRKHASLDVAAAAERLRGVVERTPMIEFDAGDARVALRLKLENRQVTGAFKARGAWNQISLLTPEERAKGVVATSSGNHAGALAWAAQRAGVPATVVMPANAYPNKIAACRARGAEVVLAEDRLVAETTCAELVASGLVLVHPYDAERTAQGAGTVGLEIAQEWPEVEACLFPIGGGGLITGSSIALRNELGEHVKIVGVEPEGSPNMTRALEAGKPVLIDPITTKVQGLCPPDAGAFNVTVCMTTLDGVLLVGDELVYDSQARMVRAGEVVEPAGAAAAAAVFAGRLPAEWLEGRSAANPLRVVAVVSGGNPDPAQLEAVRGG